MAYALRYYKEIAQTDGGVVRLEIHKKDSTTSAVEIGAVVQGLSLEIQGQQNDIDTPIQKTSLHMTFVDASDIENGQKNGFWEEFYTPDALMWRVILKAKDAGETSFRTIWGGYVTPDSFSEDLVYRGSVSITARDNIGHMQDFPFDALGDKDGLISLYNLVSMGWEKIQSPMDLLWNGLDWLSCNDVIAYHTLMNVSQFKDMNWYKAIETALASYGAVMRYAGENEVYVTTLRYMPSLGRNIDLMDRIDPVFIAGAQRELVPAVKRIEENVEYELEESASQPQIKVSDFSGSTETYRCKIDGVDSGNGSFGTLEHDAPVWSINNTERWSNSAGKSLFFNPHAYEIGYFSDRRGLGDEIRRFMYIAANNVDERSVSFSKTITCADLAIRIKFGLPISLNSEGGNMAIEQQNVFNLKSIRYSVTLVQNGVTNYLASHGGWVVDKQEITTEFDTSSQVSDFECIIGMGEFLGHADLTFTIHKIEYAQMSYANLADYGLYACIQDFSLATPTSLSLREKNTVNTIYNADNNVILSRDPELGPAFDKVALPAFIKNGIFYRNGNEILPARLWSWGGSEQQMAVWNHLQLLCYYAKPNNLISGTIVNADITRVAAIYEWNHAEHILVSGRYNFLNGHIEGAVLREFARYEDMWSEVAGAAMPETEQDSRSNVEGGASSSASPSTYTATQNVNIGTGGGGGTGASYLGDLQDVDVAGVVAQSVLYYNGTSWVDMSFASLVNPLLNPYLKADVASSTYATKEALSGVETAVSANATAIAGLGTRMTNAETELGLRYSKTEVNNLLAKYLLLEAESQTIKGNVTIEGNLIVAGDTSTGGTGSNPEVAGTLIGIKVNGETYKDPVNGILTIPDYPTSLEWSAINGKPTKLTEFTNDAGFITGITASNVTNALGYTPLSTGGGTITSASTDILNIMRDTTDGSPVIKFSNKSGTLGYIGVSDEGKASVWNSSLSSVYTLYHTGNFNPADYLPLSGGTIGGSTLSNIPLTINSNATSGTYLRFNNNATYKVAVGWNSSDGAFLYNKVADRLIGVNDNGTPYFSDGTQKALIHSGGGKISTSDFAPLDIDRDATSGASAIAYSRQGSTLGYLGFNDSTGPKWWDTSYTPYTLIHSGNIGSQSVNYATYAGTLLTPQGVAYTAASGAEKLVVFGTASSEGFNTSIRGNNVYLRYGANTTIGLILNSSGNVTFGASDLAGTSWKAYINGSTRIANITITSGVLNANRNVNTGALLDSSKMGFEIEPFASYIALKGYNTSGTGVGGVNITSSGNVLIGTTEELRSGTKLQVSGYALSTRGWLLSGDYGMLRGSTFSGSLVETDIAYNATKHIFFSGNVGISVNNPQYKLDVNGNSRINGNLVVAGDTSTGSDIRFKDKLSDHRIALSDIANAPLFTFRWNDREDDSVHLGSSAQYWEKVAPWLVKGEDFKTLDYSTLGVAIGISLANKTINLEDRVKILEKENEALKAEIRRIQYGS